MSTRRTSMYWTINCDGSDCWEGWFGPSDVPVRKVRAAAARVGWRYVPGHPTTGSARDLCPQHAAAVSVSQPPGEATDGV